MDFMTVNITSIQVAKECDSSEIVHMTVCENHMFQRSYTADGFSCFPDIFLE